MGAPAGARRTRQARPPDRGLHGWQILQTQVSAPRPAAPAPTWKQFLTAQARGIIAVDFVHVDTVLLRRVYALIVIEHGTRRVRLAGITAHPGRQRRAYIDSVKPPRRLSIPGCIGPWGDAAV